MIRISKMADYAVVILSVMGRGDVAMMSAASIAQKTMLSEPTVAKILKTLARAQMVQASRGTHGGYSLLVAPEQLSIASVIEAVDGPIGITACVDGQVQDCNLTQVCSVRGRWDDVNATIRKALSDITLRDMSSGCCKTEIFQTKLVKEN